MALLPMGGLQCKVVDQSDDVDEKTDDMRKSSSEPSEPIDRLYQVKLESGNFGSEVATKELPVEELNGQFSFLRQFTWNAELRKLMTDEIIDLRQDRRDLIQELQLTREANDRLHRQLHHAKAAQEQLDRANEDKVRLLRGARALHEECERLRSEVMVAQEVHKRLQVVNGDKLRLARRLGEMMDNNVILQKELEKANKENTKLIEMVEEANEDREGMRKSLENASDDLQRMKRDMETANFEKARLWQRLQQAHDKQAKMMDELIATAGELGNS